MQGEQPAGRADDALAKSQIEFFDVHLRGAPREALYRVPLVPSARFETR